MIEARDANGQEMPGVAMRIDIPRQGVLFDYGRLSARNVVTGGGGRASLIYTAPLQVPEPGGAVDGDQGFTGVTILVTPVGSDFSDTLFRSVDIRLVPPTGDILPPHAAPVASFTVSTPTNEDIPITFDASASSDPDGLIQSYAWNFGDGTTGTGATVTKTYSGAGSFSVTLTVTDDRGATGSITQTVTVSTSADHTASFVRSTTGDIPVGDTVNFNASGSSAVSGRTIVSYELD